MYFHKWKLLNFLDFTEVCSQGSNWQKAGIGPDNGLATNRQQAIIWTSDGIVCWCRYVSLGFDESTELLTKRNFYQIWIWEWKNLEGNLLVIQQNIIKCKTVVSPFLSCWRHNQCYRYKPVICFIRRRNHIVEGKQSYLCLFSLGNLYTY